MVHTLRGSRIGRSSYDFIDYTRKTENVLARCSVDEILDREARSIVAQKTGMWRELPASSRSEFWLWSDRCLCLRARGSLARQTANAYLALSLSCAIVPASGLRTVQVVASLTRLSSSPSSFSSSFSTSSFFILLTFPSSCLTLSPESCITRPVPCFCFWLRHYLRARALGSGTRCTTLDALNALTFLLFVPPLHRPHPTVLYQQPSSNANHLSSPSPPTAPHNDLIPSHGHPLTRLPSHPHTHYTHIHKYCIYYSSPSLPRPIPPSSLPFPSNVPALPGRTGRALALCVSSPRIRSIVYIYL